MKKTLSLIVIMTMLLSLVAMLGISVSAANTLEKKYEDAKDGDVLYNALFNQTEGVFVPKVFSAASEALANDFKVEVSADGKEVSFTHSSDSGRVWWGAPIEGLTLGEDKAYTITATVSFPRHRSGFYLTFGPHESTDITTNYNYQKAVGFYGNENAGSFMYGGDCLAGLYNFDGVDYQYYYPSGTPADTINDVVKDITLVVDGYDIYFYMDGYFVDMTTIPAKTGYDNLGISAYLYNGNALMSIKDVVIKKGVSLINSTEFPKAHRNWPYNENPADPAYQGKDYASAKDGEKLLDLKFNSKTGAYAPNWSATAGIDYEQTIIKADSLKIAKSDKGQTWFGGILKDYRIAEENVYTFQFKVKCQGTYTGGFFFNSGSANNICFETRRNSLGVYGNFNDTTGDMKVKMGANGDAMSGYDYDDVAYATKVNPLVDTDGFTDMRVVVKGYDYLVYVKDASGDYKLVGTLDLTKDNFVDSDYLAFHVYIYQSGRTLTVKDAAVFKGDLFNPVAPEQPETPDTPVVPTGDNALVLAVLALISVISLAGVKLARNAR